MWDVGCGMWRDVGFDGKWDVMGCGMWGTSFFRLFSRPVEDLYYIPIPIAIAIAIPTPISIPIMLSVPIHIHIRMHIQTHS